MAEVRERKMTPNGNATEKTSVTKDSQVKPQRSGVSVTDVLRIVGGLLLLNCALSYFITNDSVAWGWRPWFSQPGQVAQYFRGPLRLTESQLRAYDGTHPDRPIYLALNGTIYDVTAGRRFYGPGGSYSMLVGRDAARAFVTGCFDTDLVGDLRGVEDMYMPTDDPEAAPAEHGAAETRVRHELEHRLALKKVAESLEGWETMFRGDAGKPYFKVGEVAREPDWLEKRPVPELCAKAQRQRPVRGSRKDPTVQYINSLREQGAI